MRAGEFPDGAHVLRLKIDMASPNVNMRDPAIYRIRHASHHRTGDKWCIYPLYDYTHAISDALERITHSICTLEFQDHRPLYDWVIEKLADGGQLERPLPQQYEFARLNLTYVVLSKRRLIELVEKGHVDGWDDPRMPTLVGARRRGFTPEGFRLLRRADRRVEVRFVDRHERARRLHARRPQRARAAAHRGARSGEARDRQLSRRRRARTASRRTIRSSPELGKRALPLTRELWIERDDYTETPPKGYFRLTPGAEVRLRYGYIVRCVGADKDAAGNVTAVHCTYDPATRSGTPGADARKVKGNIHWLSAAHAVPAEVRLYDRLFKVPFPGARNPWGVRADVAGRRMSRARRTTSSSPATTTTPSRSPSAIISTTSIRNRSASSRRSSSRRWPRRRRRSACSSSGTAISSPTWPITRPGSRCSIAPSRCGIPGPSPRRVERLASPRCCVL